MNCATPAGVEYPSMLIFYKHLMPLASEKRYFIFNRIQFRRMAIRLYKHHHFGIYGLYFFAVPTKYFTMALAWC